MNFNLPPIPKKHYELSKILFLVIGSFFLFKSELQQLQNYHVLRFGIFCIPIVYIAYTSGKKNKTKNREGAIKVLKNDLVVTVVFVLCSIIAVAFWLSALNHSLK